MPIIENYERSRYVVKGTINLQAWLLIATNFLKIWLAKVKAIERKTSTARTGEVFQAEQT